jgi:transcription-repair coupling factor (superfamily II helicase)
MNKKSVTILLPKGQKEEYYKYKFVELMRFILTDHKESVKFEQKEETMKLVIKNNFSQRDGDPESPEKLLEFLIDFSKNVRNLFDSNFAKDKSIN